MTQLVMELHSVKQGQQESMESFEQRRRRVLRDLRSKQHKEQKARDGSKDQIMPGLFTEGLANHILKIHLQQNLNTNPLASIDYLIKLCRTLAPEPTEQTHQQQQIYQAQPNPMYNQPMTMYQSQPPKTYQTTQVQSRRPGSGLLPTPRDCWSCGSTAHIQRGCPMRTGNNQTKISFWRAVAVKVTNDGGVMTTGGDCSKKFSKLKSCYSSRRGCLGGWWWAWCAHTIMGQYGGNCGLEPS